MQVFSEQLDLWATVLVLDLSIRIGKEVLVHVLSLSVEAVVPNYYAIWIYAWENPPVKCLAQFVGRVLSCQQVVDETVSYEGGVGLSRVLPAYHHNHWLRLFASLSVTDLYHGDIYVTS